MLIYNTKEKIIGWSFLLVMVTKPIIDLFWKAPLLFGIIKPIWVPYLILPMAITVCGMKNIKWKKHETLFIIILTLSIAVVFLSKKKLPFELYIRMIGSFIPILFFDQITNKLTQKDVILFLKLYLWSLMLPCFISLMQMVGWYPQRHRYLFAGGYNMQNAFVAYLVPGFIVAIYMVFEEKKRYYLLFAAIVLFYLSAVNMMATRITVIFMVATFAISYIYKNKKIKGNLLKKLTYIYSIPVIVAIIFIVVKFDINLSERNWVWGQYVDYLKEEGTVLNILFGTGNIVQEMPHNDYLGIFIVFGIVALALYLYLIRKRLKQCIDGIAGHQQEWLLRACFINAVIAWFFNSMMVTISYYMIMTWTNMIWIILIAVLTKQEEKQVELIHEN